jgi:organic anion transporter 5A
MIMSDKQLLLSENKVSKVGLHYEYNSRDWRTKWLRLMSKPEIFLINFSIVAIFQGSVFTYMVGSISTLEKRYSFDSKISGLILIADNVSQIFISPLVGYLGNKYNRPRIMAIGELIAAFSCFVFAAPYFIFGSTLLSLQDITTHGNSTHDLCKSSLMTEECSQSTVWSAVIIFWMASFLNGMSDQSIHNFIFANVSHIKGIGCTAFYTIGIPYIDDNTSKKNSPIFLSTSAALRLFGPALGLLLSSHTLKFYENPNSNCLANNTFYSIHI